MAPLDVRIGTIEKAWDGKFKEVKLRPVAHDSGAGYSMNERGMGLASEGAAVSNQVNDKTVVPVERDKWDAVGESSEQNLEIGRKIRAGLQEEWVDACHNREYAQALVFGFCSFSIRLA